MATVPQRIRRTARNGVLRIIRTVTPRARPVKPKYRGPKVEGTGGDWGIDEINRKSSRQATPRGAMSGVQIRSGIWYPIIRPESLVQLTDMVWIVGATVDRVIEESTKGGYRFDPKFGAKCLVCDAEYDSKPEECETEGCGGREFEQADPKLLEPVTMLLERPNWDDETKRVYKPFGDLLRDVVYYMLVIDDWHWEVVFDEAQEAPSQIWSVNSEFMRQVADAGLRIGKWFCPECLKRRGVDRATYNKEIEECPECHTALLRTHWIQIDENEEVKAVWAKTEILHDQARARGKRVMGRSKVLRCWAMAQILRWMEVHQWSIYSGQHDPANFITIPWMTQAEVNDMMADWAKFQEDHPTYSGSMWLGLASSVSPEQKGGAVQVNNLMGKLVDLDAVNLAMHYTKAICMNFGVSPEMIGVQEAGKLGHPEEVLQVSYDTIQEVQTQQEDFVNHQLMPFYPEAAEQWVFKMNPPAPEDEKKKAEEALAWVNVLNALRQAGAVATLDPSIQKDWPIQIESWQEPMMPGQLGGPEEGFPPEESGTPPPGEPGQGPGEEDEPLPFRWSFLEPMGKGLVARKAWVPYTGPHGGRGWRRGDEVRYQTAKPSEREPRAPSTPSTGAGPESEEGYQRPVTEQRIDEIVQRLVEATNPHSANHVDTIARVLRHNLFRDRSEASDVLGIDNPSELGDLDEEEAKWTGGDRPDIRDVRQRIGNGEAKMLKFQKTYNHILDRISHLPPKPFIEPEDPSGDEISLKRLQQARTDHTFNAFRGLYADRDVMYRVSQEREATVLLKEADSWSFDPGIAAGFACSGYQGPQEDRDPVLLHFEASEDDIISGWPFSGYRNERELVIGAKAFGKEFEATHVIKTTFGAIAKELVDDSIRQDILNRPRNAEREIWVVSIRKKKAPTETKRKKGNLLDLADQDNDVALQRAIRGEGWLWYEPPEERKRPERGTSRPTKEEYFEDRLARKEWVPYTGSRGGHGWKETTTGEIRYQREKPAGEAHPRAEEPGAPAKPELAPGEVDLERQPTPATLEKWVEKAMADPRIQKFKGAIAAGEATFKKFRREDGTYEPERAKLHEDIIERLLNPKAKAEEGETPRVIFLLGQPASGKTTVLGRYAQQLGRQWTTISADDAKRLLPEYEGWNAALLHEESSDIAEGKLKNRALAEKHHIVMDWTGANVDKVRKEVEHFAENGYDITLLYVDVPIEASVFRAYRRLTQEGRYVPLDYITGRIDKKPLRSYEEMKSHPAVKHWAHFDNSGSTVRIVDAGEREPGRGRMPTIEERLTEDWNNQRTLPDKPFRSHIGWALSNRLDRNNIDASLNKALEDGERDWKEFRIYRKYATPRDTSPLDKEEKEVLEKHRGIPQACWYNSQLAVARDERLTYVEGVWTSAENGFHPVPHGWVELNGKVIDLTLPTEDRDKGIYYGVPFKRQDVMRVLAEEGTGRPMAMGPPRSKRRAMREDNRRRRAEVGA